MHRSGPNSDTTNTAPWRRTRTLIAWGLLLALVAWVATNVATLRVLSAVRAYVAAESLWTTARHDATQHLLRYSDTSDPAALAGFDAAIAVPLGSRAARLALDAPVPDKAAARRGFLQAGSHPEDAGAMIDLFLWFRNGGFMTGAIDRWSEVDRETARLAAAGERLRGADAPPLADAERVALRAELRAADARSARAGQRFAEVLAEASRMTQALGTAITTGLALLVASGGALALRGASSRIHHAERALRDSDARWTLAAQAAKVEAFYRHPVTGVVTPCDQGVPPRSIGVHVDITERVHLENELAACRARFEAFTNASGQILYDWNTRSDEVSYAGNVIGILGLAPGQLNGALSLWLDRVHPHDRERVAQTLRQPEAAHDVIGLEYRLQRADGAWITLSQEGRTIAAHDDQPARLVGLIADVSERKAAQAALLASEQRYRTLWETAPEAVVILDDRGRIDYANAAVARTFGWEPHELIGQNIERLQPPRLRQAHHHGMDRYLRSGKRTMDWRAAQSHGLHRDGHEIALEISFSHMTIDGTHSFAGFLRDVEGRKRAEAANTRLANLLEKSVNEVFVYRADTLKFVYVNASARDNLRRVQAEMLLLGPADIAADTSIDALRLRLEPLLRGERKTLTYETEHVRSDGSRYPAEVNVQLIGEGADRELLATALDISARKAAEAARGELLSQLRQSQKMEALGTLAGGIAHDFNNIVGSMLGNAALAHQDLPPDHAAARSVEQIQRAALRARDLVRQILAFSRRQPPTLVVQALQPIVQDMAQLLRATLPATLSLELSMVQEPVWIEADRSQVEQVLMNLCTNAWHAVGEDSAMIRIGVGWKSVELDEHRSTDGLPPGRYAHLTVSDNGVGMDAATQARIFEPFFTTKPVGDGTGLGLSVVHGIVIAHDGAIEVESEPGRGTTFHVLLPQRPPAERDGPPLPAGQMPSLAMGQGQRLLYIDDDEVMLLMVERLLQRAGYRVTAHRDAATAIEAIQDDPDHFDLLITDYNMPEISGLAVARSVAQLRADLPVILISGDLSDGLVDRARALSIAAVVPKELAFDQLATVVQRHLGIRHAAASPGR